MIRVVYDNSNTVMIEIYDKHYLPLKTRGFDDAGKATRWLLDFLYEHPGVHFAIFLNYQQYLRTQKARRRWRKTREGMLKWMRILRRRRG